MDFKESLAELPLKRSAVVARFQRLLEPCSNAALDEMARQAHALTRQQFGRTMRLFAPLYLSNECINNCRYCGFSRDNPILRVTLSVPQVVEEARHLAQQGFRHLLLVAGEHPKFVATDYLAQCVEALAVDFASLSLEVGPLQSSEYERLVSAGAEGLVVYQETYDREIYATVHVSGPKRDFDWRLETPLRAYRAGFRKLGIGALLGLAPWKGEAIALAAHVEYLLRHCWKSHVSVSLPRLRPAAGGFTPEHSVSDRELIQLVCALRITFPQIGLVLSTREPADLRDTLAGLGITMMSAGSHTEPGGYTGQGQNELHLTVRGKIIPAEDDDAAGGAAGCQFEISDQRSPKEIAEFLQGRGYDPVWKDWDAAVLAS